jgi:hypothetical protein
MPECIYFLSPQLITVHSRLSRQLVTSSQRGGSCSHGIETPKVLGPLLDAHALVTVARTL